MDQYQEHDHVLVRGIVTKDGRCIVVAPGVELPIAAVQIICELPRPQAGLPVGMVMLFPDEASRAEFAEIVRDEPGVETVDI